MSSIWEPFTERARRVAVLAGEVAQQRGERYIGSEHYLIGIMEEEAGLAAIILRGMGATVENVRREVELIVGHAYLPKGDTTEFIHTPRMKRCIELAYEAARQYNCTYIATEHLLLGLVREGSGVAGRVLANLGINAAMIEDRVRVAHRIANPDQDEKLIISHERAMRAASELAQMTWGTPPYKVVCALFEAAGIIVR